MKLSRDEYIMKIADTLVNVYGETLMEGETDIRMAKSAFNKIKKYLFIHPHKNTKKYARWKKLRMLRSGLWQWVLDKNGRKTNRLTDGMKEWIAPK